MCIDRPNLGWVRITGTHYDIGFALGRQGRHAVHENLLACDLWAAVASAEHRTAVSRMAATTKALFPNIFCEIEGLADGLDLPFGDVFAWNCRGDLLAHSSDGCTTVQVPGDDIIIAHNEDGLPFFDGHCFIAEIAGLDGFTSFCYPGSIPGHTFAATRSGLVMAANNLRLTGVTPTVPRMVLGRAMLNCSGLDDVRNLLDGAPASGGFHYSLTQTGQHRLISLEFGGGGYIEKEVTRPSVHANHAVLGHPAHRSQIITESSRDRQTRGAFLVTSPGQSAMEILRDTGGGGLPIWRRCPDDPDNENTVASARFFVSGSRLDWTFFAGNSKVEIYDSEKFRNRGPDDSAALRR